MLPLQKAPTPDARTIEEVAAFMDVPKKRFAKVVLFTGSIEGAERVVGEYLPVGNEVY